MYRRIKNFLKRRKKVKDVFANEEQAQFDLLLIGLINYLKRNGGIMVSVNDHYVGHNARTFEDSGKNIADYLEHNFIYGTSYYYHQGRWQIFESETEEKHYFEAVKRHCLRGFLYMFEKVPSSRTFRKVDLEFRVLKELK